ncbi:MAG TPA: hypothetical protein VKP30_31780, partial [Polyangiaceae bacterium]|nr:hypothetical protein [Polyangiaceae bacterium]
MYDTKTASQSSVERGSLGASKAMRTHALGETRPLVRSIGMEIETQAPSSTPRRGRQTAIGDLGADQQEQPAFD